jgi:Ca2+-binding EF-hand superfamily protein
MKRTTKFFILPLITAAGLGLVAGGALAHGQGAGARGGEFMNAEFTDFDLNGDGLITLEDLKARADARFAEADADGDGKLSVEEMTAAAEARMAERMAERMGGRGGLGQGQHQGRMGGQGPDMAKRLGWMTETMLEKRDADGDGMLSQAEMQGETRSLERMERMIDRFDTDDDNAISAAEFEEAQKQAWLRGQHRDGGGRNRY